MLYLKGRYIICNVGKTASTSQGADLENIRGRGGGNVGRAELRAQSHLR